MSASRMIVVVGIGADGMAGLAPASRAELRRATVIYGSDRQLDLLDDSVRGDAARVAVADAARAAGRCSTMPTATYTCVASGDPLLHGIGSTLIRLYGARPGHSAAARVVGDAGLRAGRLGRAGHRGDQPGHRRARTPRCAAAARRSCCRATDHPGDAGAAAERRRPRRLRDHACSSSSAARPNGAATASPGTGRRAARRRRRPQRDRSALPARRTRVHALPDDAFAHDGQITKQTIRAVTLAALAPRPGELLWDVGAGSGSIAVEWCRSWPGCTAVAFERDEQRRKRIARSMRTAFGAMVDVRGAAPEAFDGAPEPAAIFIGGGLTQPGLLDACFDRLAAGGRLVANAVTAESEAVVAQWYSRLGGELRRFQHYRGEPLGQVHRLASRDARDAVGGHQGMTVYFIGAGPGRRRSDHRARPAAAEPLPGVPVRGLDHARRPAGAVPAGCPGRRHRAADARPDHR